jgi:uncharacterized membrane protein
MNMRINILPKTPLGWWSVGLGILFLILFTSPLLGVLVRLQSAYAGLFPIGLPPGGIMGIVFAIAGAAALVTGLISIIRSKERSILAFLAMIIGLFLLVFVLGEWLHLH